MKTKETNGLNAERGKRVAQICAKYKKEDTCIYHCNGWKDLQDAVKKHWSRQGHTELPSVKEFADALICNKLRAIANCIPPTYYSMGDEIIVSCSKLKGTCDTRRDYANSCTWKPTHGYVHVKLTPFEFRNISAIGGLATFIAPNQRGKVKSCWWFSSEGSKNRYELIRKEGYIYEGYHSESKANALAGGLKNIELAKQKAVAEKKYARALRMQYTYQDSLDAHNCENGTRAFALRCKLDTAKKYRGAFLLKRAEKMSTSSVAYVAKMIAYKAANL